MASTRWAASRFHTLAFVSTIACSPLDDALGTVEPDSTRLGDPFDGSVAIGRYRAKGRLTEADIEPDLTTLVLFAEDIVVSLRPSPRIDDSNAINAVLAGVEHTAYPVCLPVALVYPQKSLNASLA